jgi:hypothetical protein
MQRLDEFHQLLETFRLLHKSVGSLAAKYPIKSERLTKLLTIGKLFPDYISILDDFDGMVTWKKSGSQKIAEPKLGLDQNFDTCNKDVDDAK